MELQGDKDSILKIYNLSINANETDEQKILDVINSSLGKNITKQNIHSVMVESQLKEDQDVASALLVNGTPSVYFDGEKDTSKNRYKNVKVH